MSVTVTDTDPRVLDLTLRMPFHFGDVTATERPLLLLGVTADFDGETRRGVASDTMLPKWFLKGWDYDEALDAMVAVIDAACRHAESLDGEETVFDYWLSLYQRQREWAEDTDYPPLLWNFGVSLVERGVIDAVCRHHDVSFAEAVRENVLGIELGRIYDRLEGHDPAAFLPEAPRHALAVRHTVGHTDPLSAEDVPPGERLDDGLPQSLREYIETDGISYFKIKLVGDVERDLARVGRVASTIEDAGLDAYAYTFDANEQYPEIDDVRRFYEELQSGADTAAFAEHLLAIEQPVPRESALTDETRNALESWGDRPPIVIDESDGEIDSLARALACGYAGTSHKNCKGVFKGIANTCLVDAYNRDADTDRYRITAEDLMNVGPVALLQDLAVVATLGIEHVERNGHHYFRGLDFLPQDVQEAVGRAHGDLYADRDGYWALDVHDGTIDVGSVVDAPFGVGLNLDLDRFTHLSTWLAE